MSLSRTPFRVVVLGIAVALAIGAIRQQDPLSEPFLGVTADGTVEPGLFSIEATGVSTEPMKTAAESFLAGLSVEQRESATFAVDDIEWRMWQNVHRAERQGVSFEEMTEVQRELAIGLMSVLPQA